MTEPERKLWSLLWANQLGVKIRRQVPVGRYIVDFLCQEKKLIFELDGSQHYEVEGRNLDKIRDEYLRTFGYTVLRIDYLEMLKHPDEILMQIESLLRLEYGKSEPAKTGP